MTSRITTRLGSMVAAVLVVLLVGSLWAENTVVTGNISYLSADHVYIDLGSQAGLTIGQKITVLRNSSAIAELDVLFVSEHSASCAVVSQTTAVAVGDQVRAEVASTEVSAASDTTSPTTIAAPPVVAPIAPAETKSSPPELSGRLSLGFSNWNDQTESDLSYSESTARLNFRVTNLAERNLTFVFRSRGRYEDRASTYAYSTTQHEWNNRLYEASLGYMSENGKSQVQLGRVLNSSTTSAGYIDGLVGKQQITGRMSLGAFAGIVPRWQFDERRYNLAKVGLFSELAYRRSHTAAWSIAFGVSGEYYRSEVNREYMFTQGRLTGPNWTIAQVIEFDLNRGWRKDRSGSSLELSNAVLSAQWRPVRRFNLALTYDNRRAYWTQEFRTLADSLFDDRLRQGVRLSTDLTISRAVAVSAGGGYRKRSGDADPTWTYMGGLRLQAPRSWRSSLFLNASAFDGPVDRGVRFSSRLSQPVGNRHTASVGFNTYAYSAKVLATTRSNHTLELGWQSRLNAWLLLDGQYEFHGGDDESGHRVMLDLGIRF